MTKISKKFQVIGGLLFLAVVAISYQNCGAPVGGAGFNINLGSSGVAGGTISVTNRLTNKLALGYEHSCAITTGGGVECWGAGSQGQLGYGALVTYSLTPTAVIGLPGPVSKISSGSYFTCALITTGAIYCWGDDTYGQLGNATQSTQSASAVAAVVETNPAFDIATSSGTTCAVLSTGIVQCWGLNGSGELGNGSQTDNSAAGTVLGVTNAISIAAGNNHFCATLSTGGVACWGLGTSGQLGNQTSTTAQLSAVAVIGVSSAARTVAGGVDTCSLLSSGTVSCWGDNQYGDLGNGTSTPSLAVSAVIDISGVTDLSVGQYSGCALVGTGVKCWGYNGVGNLGDGNATNTSIPTSVTGLQTSAVAIASGTYHSCAYLSTGAVNCWGFNNFGQLGNGTTVNSTKAVVVTGFQ
jgi:alpha-tubulin suppressor-like RCC1 family protein